MSQFVDIRTGQPVEAVELASGSWRVQYLGGDKARGRVSAAVFFRYFQRAYDKEPA